MAALLSLYLFGDQTTLSREDLRALLLVGGNPILTSFIDQATLSLRKEIQSLSWSQRERFPSFSSLLDLLAIDTSKPLHPALQLALSSVHHFALFLCQRSSELESSTSADVSYTFGFGTGLLAAVAVSCCPKPDELLPVALETVLISFRIGLLAADIGDQIVVDKASPASWRVKIETDKSELVLQQLDEFCTRKHLPTWSKPYVCSVSHDSTLLSGIPTLLSEFVDTHHLSASVLPVYAPYHGSPLFSDNDVERIVQSFSPTLPDVASKFTLLSHLDGKAATPGTLLAFLTVAVKAILREHLASDDILRSIEATVQPELAQQCTIISIGTTSGSKLAAMVQNNGISTGTLTFVDDKAILNGITTSHHAKHSKIAITGFSGRFPESENIHEFWDMLRAGVDTHSETPATRWDVKTHVDPSLKAKNTSGTPWGCWLNNPGLFDRSFFAISPREAPQMDPAQRLALMCAYEALEMAGIVADATPSTMKSRVGVFIGATSNDWCETNSAQDVDFYFIPGGNRAFIPGRINYYFKFSGPSFSVDTACSSSLAATHLACGALWRKEIDTAIVGGTNILTNPDVTAGLDRGHFLSRTGNCKSFDDGADGYCRGEGVGIVVLKRLADAQAENDPIYGCILSAVTNHSAEAESITRPHVGAQQALFSQILGNSGVHPNDISYVEMHGTGTQAGDSREMSSVSSTFAPWPPGDPRGRDSDMYVGSVKSNVGHGESVSGVTGLIKILLMMKNNEIPPHCGIKTKINQTFPPDLHDRRIQIANKATPWTRTDKPRRALVNNFSAAGGNSCILVEDAPEKAIGSARPDVRPAHVITLTAKSQTALEANIRSMAGFLQRSPGVSLPDLAYTSTARRVHHNFRIAYVARTVQELSKSLEDDAAKPPQQVRGPPKMIFAFSGQGSNHTGMGKHLYDTNATIRMELNRFDAIARDQGFGPILPYIRGMEEPTHEASPLTVQLAHVSLQMALARLWKSWGIQPAAVVGHSLGEYAALNYAGVLSDFDVLSICGQRAQLLAAHCRAGTHAMLAVRSSHQEVAPCLDGIDVEIACINSLRDTVVSGANEQIDKATQQLESKGIRCSKVNLPYAFHSSQLEPIMESLSTVLDGTTLKRPTVPVLSPLLSTVIKVGEEIGKDYLLRQCREAVNLVGAVQAAQAASLLDERSHVLEIGPSLVVARLMQRTMEKPPTMIPSLEPNQDSWLVLSRSAASVFRVGCNVNWAQYHRDYDHSVIELPSYGWDLKNYWMQYVHDWSLRKGDPLPAIPTSTGGSRLELAATSCQRVVSADFTGDGVRAVIESDLQDKTLKPVVGGHRVNGIAVCVGAVYSDMAVSCAKSILKCYQDDTSNTAILINDMDMQEALIVSDIPEPQIVRIEANCVWHQKKVEIAISSADDKAKNRKVHAKATVVFVDLEKERQKLREGTSSPSSHIESLKISVASGDAERFTKSMAYRMVASLAHYDSSHKGVRECSLDSTSLEASAVIASPAQDRLPGDFSVHPCVFDSILQLATFVLNANENSRFDQEVYVVRGWETVFIDEVLSPDAQYETYVQMNARDKDVATGDIAIMKDNTLIGCIKGVRVQRVPRRLMDVMFRPLASSHQPSSDTHAVKAEVNAPMGNAPGEPSMLDKALNIIAEESGISLNEFKEEDLLSDIGIDSLLILVIASRFREELHLDLQPSFFMEVCSIGAIRKFFNAQAPAAQEVDDGPESPANSSGSGSPKSLQASTRASSVSDESRVPEAQLDSKDQVAASKPVPVSTSIILQGTMRPTTKTIFMFPDGSGSATSYMHLPRVHEDVAVVGLNCPYMTHPKDMEGTFIDITKILLAEVRRRQPKGPYYLGGWSAGGAFAHCASQMLIDDGEEVKALLLIDAPCPIGLGKLPQLFFDYWRTIHQPGGMVADRPLPSWLMDHFQAVNENLRHYTAQPLTPGHSPKTYLVWAARGTDNLAGFQDRHLLTPEESEDLGFLMDDKTDFSTRGWERLVEGEITIERAMSSNHFTITRGEGAAHVSSLIKRACLTQT